MLPIRTVLHPTDFSDRSRNALDLACSVARDYGARLVVLHVLHEPAIIYGEGVVPPDPEESRIAARNELDQIQPTQLHLSLERRMEAGSPPAEILRVADELSADLIVMGTHGRSGLMRLLMGSVAEEVVRRSHCPVLTVTAPAVPATDRTVPVAERAATQPL